MEINFLSVGTILWGKSASFGILAWRLLSFNFIVGRWEVPWSADGIDSHFTRVIQLSELRWWSLITVNMSNTGGSFFGHYLNHLFFVFGLPIFRLFKLSPFDPVVHPGGYSFSFVARYIFQLHAIMGSKPAINCVLSSQDGSSFRYRHIFAKPPTMAVGILDGLRTRALINSILVKSLFSKLRQ